ncbi:MAG: flagellar biosynthetic protein FliO [Acidobacteriota bacterium]
MEFDWLFLVRVLLSLVVVLGLAVVLLRFGLPRISGLQVNRETRLQLIELRPLDRQHKLALVRARDSQLLLGLGDGRVTLLQTWPDGALPAPAPARDTAAAGRTDFAGARAEIGP